jgi:hypothetical protein
MKIGSLSSDIPSIFLFMEKTQSPKLTSMKDPEPYIVAEAIGAFALNNRIRELELNLPCCKSITFPCLTMVGTTPIFYKIIVTAALSQAVQTGAYPEIETRVLRVIFLPFSEGMVSAEQTRDLAMNFNFTLHLKNSWETETGWKQELSLQSCF